LVSGESGDSCPQTGTHSISINIKRTRISFRIIVSPEQKAIGYHKIAFISNKIASGGQKPFYKKVSGLPKIFY
jgi:hypothetical protein